MDVQPPPTMDFLSEIYFKCASENERNLRFWENYLQNLKSLDFSFYSDKLKVPVLVPIGSRILFRGELKHTNEITAALGADYFAKCSLNQAEVLRQHRIKDAQHKVDMLVEEKEYLDKQMSFKKNAVYDNQGQEIVEPYSEEDDKLWRRKHRENVRHYKQNKGKEERAQINEITDEELWNRLEELELQEELENELSNIKHEHQNICKTEKSKEESLIFKAEDHNKSKTERIWNIKESIKKQTGLNELMHKPEFKSFMLQRVIDKQNELEEKLIEIKNRDRNPTKTENELMSRLDELEQLEELEDEMDRLDDVIENEDLEKDEDDSIKSKSAKLERRVSFVDEDDSETLEITFVHSPVALPNEPFDPIKGIQKPSDIYAAHSNLFGNGTTSILKKSKYGPVTEISGIKTPKDKNVQFNTPDNSEHQTIVIKDVAEKDNKADPKLLSQARPTSLFKKKRMLNKK